MPRPAVLVVDPQAPRRRELSRGLASLGYEVIPAIDERQGRVFAKELALAVVVAPLGFMGTGAEPSGALSAAAAAFLSGGGNDGGSEGSAGGAAIATVAPIVPMDGDGTGTPEPGRSETGNGRGRRTLLLLGEREQDGDDLPEEISYLATGGLAPGELVRRVHVLLLGREVGVEADSQLASLIGDLELTPLLELLRALQRAEVSGRLVHAAGEVTLIGGQVVAAAAGATRGLKAFCRLSHLDSGPVRVVPADADDELALGRGGGEREIREDLKALIIRALADRVQ